jgi:hypothetical protein
MSQDQPFEPAGLLARPTGVFRAAIRRTDSHMTQNMHHSGALLLFSYFLKFAIQNAPFAKYLTF